MNLFQVMLYFLISSIRNGILNSKQFLLFSLIIEPKNSQIEFNQGNTNFFKNGINKIYIFLMEIIVIYRK